MRLTSLTSHNLAVLFVELAALLVAARALGQLARRFGQPPVMGELVAGVLLGPSFFGKVWGGGFKWFLPAHQPLENGALLTMAQFSLVILLVVIGSETDLKLIRHLGKAATSVSLFSLVIPLAAGAALALALPSALIGPQHSRGLFALLIAGAVAVSSLPVIAKIVSDLGMARRNFGQLIFAAGTAHDTFGFLVVAAATAVVGAHRGSLSSHLVVVGASLVVLVALTLTLGQRFVDRRLRTILTDGSTPTNGLALVVIGALVVTALFEVAGVEGALGAFLFGIVLGRSRYQPHEPLRVIGALSSAIFAPLYFASAGLRVDVADLGRSPVLASFLALVAVALVSKFAGAVLGAGVARLPRREWVALGVGLNGRGALQVIIGSAGLSIGALTGAAYSAVILMSIVTSLVAPPLLRATVRNWEGTPAERDRLDREDEMGRNVIVRGQRLLLPSRGSPNSIVAAEILGAAWPHESEVTVLSIAGPGGDGHGKESPDDGGPDDGGPDDGSPDDGSGATDLANNDPDPVRPVVEVLEPRLVHRRRVSSDQVLDEILAEAKLGYGIIGLGAAESPTPGRLLSPVIDDLLVRSPIPMVIVRRAHDLSRPLPAAFARSLIAVTGSAASRAAQEVGYSISRSLGTKVVLTHVVTRPEAHTMSQPARRSSPGPVRLGPLDWKDQSSGQRRVRPRSAAGAGHGVMTGAKAHAAEMAVEVSSVTRTGASAGHEIVTASEELGADLIILGSTVRMVDDRPFLGHTVEHVLEHAGATVVVVVLPDAASPSDASPPGG
ncbi:MAG: cation:proton antiporter [Acidimicrobiales bacterium]